MIKTAVIGVGSLGQHHARILKLHKKSKLKFVVDTDKKRVKKIAKTNETEYSTDFNVILDKIDAAVIAVPTFYHYKITRSLLQHGINCLVEKPFTLNIEEAEDLIELARDNKLVLQVGHVERFNPSVVGAVPFVNNPKFIEVNRLGPYDPRSNHIGVVLDLMIHDLDVLFYFIKSKVVSFEAYGAKIFSNTEDIAKARLRYANGCVADVSASRVSMEKYRKIRIFQPDSYISINYAEKNFKVYTKKGKITSLSDIDVTKPKLQSKEPLFYELDNFINNIIEGRKPSVSGEQGKNAVELALNILKGMVF
ncbi:MAG: Gfo/Idh/MocA family oxidoreductase [Endomicrobium sp.]|jgi:predicted dehydrogenase|nr:Gfo/Idh/MocA family oxidoreductase [Endomicrobium sp.]